MASARGQPAAALDDRLRLAGRVLVPDLGRVEQQPPRLLRRRQRDVVATHALHPGA